MDGVRLGRLVFALRITTSPGRSSTHQLLFGEGGAQLIGSGRPDQPKWSCGVYEEQFGDYGPGRFAWILSDVRLLQTPVPTRGRQQLWTLDPDTTDLVWRNAA